MNSKKASLIILSMTLIITGLFFYMNSAPLQMQDEVFVVKPGDSIHGVAIRLEKNNLINGHNFFKALSYVYMRRYIRSGTYKIYSGMNTAEIFNKLSKGDIVTHRVTIPEGYNIYEIAERLEEENICISGKFLYHANDRDFLQSIKINAISAEGYLFPDTYVFL